MEAGGMVKAGCCPSMRAWNAGVSLGCREPAPWFKYFGLRYEHCVAIAVINVGFVGTGPITSDKNLDTISAVHGILLEK